MHIIVTGIAHETTITIPHSMTRKLQSRILLVVIVSISIAAISLLAYSVKTSYIDFSLDFIAKKYQGTWKLMLLDFWVYGLIIIGLAIYQGWDKSALRRIISKPSQTTLHDIAIWLLRSTYIIEVLVYLLTFGLTRKIRWFVNEVFDVDTELLLTIDNIWIQQLLFFFVIDFAFYWMHRIEHAVPFLWAFHKFHHSASEMNVLNSKREHPVESELFRSIIFSIPFAIMGAPFSSYIIFQIIRKALTAIQHSDVNWSWGWFGKYIVVSPLYHEIHHSKHEDHIDKNFAGYFPLLDHVFGTYYAGPVGTIEYGVEDDNHNNTNLLRALWIPFVESFNAILDWLPGSRYRDKEDMKAVKSNKTPST